MALLQRRLHCKLRLKTSYFNPQSIAIYRSQCVNTFTQYTPLGGVGEICTTWSYEGVTPGTPPAHTYSLELCTLLPIIKIDSRHIVLSANILTNYAPEP